MCLSFTHLSKNIGQFFTLPLSTDVCSQTPLQEFESPLIFGHLKQFHGPFFVRCMAAYFSDEVPHEPSVLSLYTLESRWTYPLVFVGYWSRFVPFLKAHGYLVLWSHLNKERKHVSSFRCNNGESTKRG